MNIVILVHDLEEAKARLMPWRTVCEVVNGLRATATTAHLVSLGTQNRAYAATNGIPSGTVEIRKTPEWLERDLRAALQHFQPDVLFWPLSWRESGRRVRLAGQLGLPIVGYFPGGVNGLGSMLRAGGRLIWHSLHYWIMVRSYLFEAASPKGLFLRRLAHNRFEHLIGLSNLTVRSAKAFGWPSEKVHLVYPGREEPSAQAAVPELPDEVREWLAGSVYYLYMGPPQAIRGVHELLAAFDRAAAIQPELKLVCLFRSDRVRDADQVRKHITELRHSARVLGVWGSLAPDALAAYEAHCHALVLPFLIIPSEIPLAIIEPLTWGRPVITTSCGGTGEFVAKFGVVTRPGDVRGLMTAMLDLAADRDLHQEKCASARNAFLTHPTWSEVAEAWGAVARAAMADT